MMKKMLILVFLLIFVLAGYAQDKVGKNNEVKSDVPEKVQISFDGLHKTKTSNNIYNLKHLDTYFYVLQKSVFVNVLFTADLDAKIEELEKGIKEKLSAEKLKYDTYVAEMEKKILKDNEKIEAKNKKIKNVDKKIPLKVFDKSDAPEFKKRASYHNLYLRVLKDGNVSQEFKSEVPYNGTVDLNYFSFGLILEPGKYDLLVVVDAYDNSEDGTLISEIEVPEMTLNDILTTKKVIETSRPVFYKKVDTLLESEKRFTVVANNYQIGISKQKFFPYVKNEYKFKSGDSPILTFFLKGAKMVRSKSPWNVTGNIFILKGKKKIVSFKPIKLVNPFFFQPIKITGKKSEALKEGSYTLNIKLIDNNLKGLEGEVSIPFDVIK